MRPVIKNENKNYGIGFTGLLAIVFIVLKLLHVIEWPLIWVLAPIWIPAAFYLFILLIIFIAAILRN